MFSSLRVGSPIYVFHKNQNPVLEIGSVQSISGPRPKYQMPANITQTQQMIIDVQLKIGDSLFQYQQLPVSQEITDTYVNGESIVVSDSRGAINSEVINYQQKSKDAVNSIETHNRIIELCDGIINKLNPEYAEKQQQQEQINTLNQRIEEMTKNMEQLMDSNRKLIERFSKGESI